MLPDPRAARWVLWSPLISSGNAPTTTRSKQSVREFGVPLIEDAAEALGATYRGRPAGSFGRLGVLSFNGNKIITTSGGGALVSDDAERSSDVGSSSTQAREPAVHYEHREVGYNYRMSNILAALGRAQLATLTNASRRGGESSTRTWALAAFDGVHSCRKPSTVDRIGG